MSIQAETSDVQKQVYEVIKDVLILEDEEFSGDKSLIDEYDAESIDFLDVSFRLSRMFGVTLFRGDFLTKALSHLEEDFEFVKAGLLTEEGIALIKERMPEAENNELLKVGAPRRIMSQLFCAEVWVRQVNELLSNNKMTGEAYLEKWLDEYKARHTSENTSS